MLRPASTASRPHLKLALDSVEHIGRVVAGSEEGSMLRDLAFAGRLSVLNRLVPLVPSDQPIVHASLTPVDIGAIRLAVFAHFLLSQVILIDVHTADEDTAFSLFEPLNTTGQPLTPIETLRPLAVRAEGGLDRLGRPQTWHFRPLVATCPMSSSRLNGPSVCRLS